MNFSVAKAKVPSIENVLLAILAAILLTASFPGFEFFYAALFGLVPLFVAVYRERASIVRSFVLGWIFGIVFFFGTCWWLTFAPITYGGVPAIIAYFLLFGATLVVGLFPAIFASIFSLILRRFGYLAVFSAPFLWTATEFLRMNLTGNNWNAIGYSQFENHLYLSLAGFGGVLAVSFLCVLFNACYSVVFLKRSVKNIWFALFPSLVILLFVFNDYRAPVKKSIEKTTIVAVQPNVPMNGFKYGEWEKLQARHVELAENALTQERAALGKTLNTVVIFPESPMNFEYESDREFQTFIRDFASKNDVSVIFNSAQPNVIKGNFYNSAVMIDPHGEKIGQYDKIHLVPFGEYVPLPESIAAVVPTMVGNFQYGENYNLLPLGELKSGVMICFESHFGSLSREFVKSGADVLIEMTNDGYLGETPILRQHLANAVFRAVETNRPVLRVTNVGVTAYIDERGAISDPAAPYTEDARVWTVSKSDGNRTFYVRYGEWFAWLCSIISLALLFLVFYKKKQ